MERERDELRANLVNCVARLEAYYGEDYPAVDSYQRGRVEGIQQGIDKLREREKFYTEQEAISQGQMRLTRGLQRNESSGCIRELEKLAQHAQEGEGRGDMNIILAAKERGWG